MTLNSFLEKLKQTQNITFTETIAVIEENYTFLQRHLKMEYCTMLLERTPACCSLSQKYRTCLKATLSCFGAIIKKTF
jgi:hypothetical protein